MLDYGIIQPRLQRLYEWSAEELGEPGVLDLVRDGSPVYAWPFEHREVWAPARPLHTVRVIRRLLPVADDFDRKKPWKRLSISRLSDRLL